MHACTRTCTQDAFRDSTRRRGALHGAPFHVASTCRTSCETHRQRIDQLWPRHRQWCPCPRRAVPVATRTRLTIALSAHSPSDAELFVRARTPVRACVHACAWVLHVRVLVRASVCARRMQPEPPVARGIPELPTAASTPRVDDVAVRRLNQCQRVLHRACDRQAPGCKRPPLSTRSFGTSPHGSNPLTCQGYGCSAAT